MAVRAVWKGYLKLALVTCPVALYKATDEAERVRFTWFNRTTGNRVKIEKVDAETGEPVESSDIANGIDIGGGKFIEITDEEIADAAPKSAHEIDLREFVEEGAIDRRHVEDHYFMRPQGVGGEQAFALINKVLASEGLAALAQFTPARSRNERLVAISACGAGMMVTMLRYPAELRDAADYFAKLVPQTPLPELVKMAAELVGKRTVEFDPAKYKDRYAAAIRQVISDKIAGNMVKPRKPPAAPKMVSLEEALRRSLDTERAGTSKASRPKRTAA
jgi:DNA end-binding protein Ku